jgi:hypothetical protein
VSAAMMWCCSILREKIPSFRHRPIQTISVLLLLLLLLLLILLHVDNGRVRVRRPSLSLLSRLLSPSPESMCTLSPPPWVLNDYRNLRPNFFSLSTHNSSLWPQFIAFLQKKDAENEWSVTPAYTQPAESMEILDFVLSRQLRTHEGDGDGNDETNNTQRTHPHTHRHHKKKKKRRKRALNIAMIGGSYARGENCGVPKRPPRSLGHRFREISVDHSCSTIALTAYYLNRLLLPGHSVKAYNLAVSGCGHHCLVESIQSHYLSARPNTLHIVIIDVCVNDNAAPSDEIEMTYIEVVTLVRRRGGEVLFVCAWSDHMYHRKDPPQVNFDLAANKSWVVTPYGAPTNHSSSYNRCAVIGIRLSARYRFPVITYQDSLLSADASYSNHSRHAFKRVVSALTKSPVDTHPSMFGNDLIAQTLSRWIYWRICHVISLPHPLPQPDIPLLNGTTSSLVQMIETEETFHRLIVYHRGFDWRVEGGGKAGWISEHFGSILDVRLPLPVPTGFLSIGFLQTYSVIGLFNLTILNGGHLVTNRRVTCVIVPRFSQTAFLTVPFNVTASERVLRIRFEHLDHTDLEALRGYQDLRKFIFEMERHHFVNNTNTKVKIISLAIYDAADGLAARPREVDYTV